MRTLGLEGASHILEGPDEPGCVRGWGGGMTSQMLSLLLYSFNSCNFNLENF